MKAHSVAQLFPPMTDAEFRALKDDIARNGQREPITLWRGEIIDGVHRARACDELSIEPTTREWDGEESGLVAYVVSLNLHRRHLSTGQRGMIAQKVARRTSGPRPKSYRNQHDSDLSFTEAGTLFKVGHDTITKARNVHDHGVPELADAVERGDISVNRAAKIAKLPEQQQRREMQKPARSTTAAYRPKKKTLERVTRAVDAIETATEVLTESMASLKRDRRKADWAARLRSARTEISRFIVECEQ